MIRNLSISGAVVATLFGCSSAPVHYHTLTPVPSSSGVPTWSGVPAAVEILAVHMPAPVDRSELTLRSGSGDLELLENDKWAAAPSAEVRGAAGIELQRALSEQVTASLSKAVVTIDIRRFDALPLKYDLVDAEWQAKLTVAGATDLRLACRFHASYPIAADAGSVVHGFQQAISKLADEIAASLAASSQATKPLCQGSQDSGNLGS